MNINEDLRKWVAEKWVDIGAPKKGGGFKPCGRQEGEKRKGYPKCVPLAKARSMSKGQRQSAVKRKRAAGNAGPKPTNVSTFARKNESMNIYEQVIHIINEMHVKKAERKAMALYKKQPQASDTSAPASLSRLQYRKALSDVEAAKKKRRARLAAKGMTEKDAEDKGVKERYKKKIIPKKPDNVVDSIQRIGDLITEAAGTKWKERQLKLLKIALAAAAGVKGVNDRYIQPYGQPDNIRYDLKNPVPETGWERQRRNIQGDDYVDDWDIQALRKGRNKLGTRNFDQDITWGAHDLVTGRDREKELETREKLKPALFAHNNAVMRSLATRGTRINPTPRSGINPKMLYQKEQTELTKSFDRINNLITEVKSKTDGNKLSLDQLKKEQDEFDRAGIDINKAANGKGETLKNLKGVKNTDAEDMPSESKFSAIKKWASMQKANKEKALGKKEAEDARRRVWNQVKSNTDDPSVISINKQGEKELVAGNTRASLRRALGLPIKAHIFKTEENLDYWFNNSISTDLITEVAAWQRKEGKNPSGGLNKVGVMSYRRENPGSKLKTAVTTKPSKLKKGSKAAKRRKSFCARMGGMKKRLTSKKTASNPDSRINKALRKWNC